MSPSGDRLWTAGKFNFSPSDTQSTEAGLRTNHLRLITSLIKQFDTAKEMEQQ
ncbi:hypothetical protein H6F78_00330 [Coleofasciculus sp. FACHB-64]|uniref:hypothetical protein n=1 Tax=Cyanophyceae TaxID=3028117 RepID=UPI00168524C8|nr:hypothetical protein [Coleofasciculus sp. FACHB-64]MBD2044093.1 hypothetical protein [Coleofasciculus sp. FACHB-64]